MRALLTFILITAFITPAFAQDGRKVLAENVRSTDKILTGAPFSAEAISESVQMLADGNRITRRTVSRLFRDNEGRFRREDMPSELGLPGAVVEMPQSIVITDPVTAIRYSLNPKNLTFRQSEFRQAIDQKRRQEEQERRKTQQLARQAREQTWQEINANGQVVNSTGAKIAESMAKLKSDIDKKATAEASKEVEAELKASMKSDIKIEKSDSDSNSRTESLGTQNIEGVQAEGKRTTTTIPAGSIGNDQPIEVVYERWYSPELQLIVMSRHSDPRFGVQTYRLTNISRSEQPMTLFAPSSEYRLLDDKMPKPPVSPLNKTAPGTLIKPATIGKPPAPPAEVKKTQGT